MLPVHRHSYGGTRVYTLAAALTVLTVAVVVAVTIVDVGLADRLVSENGPIEWLQVALFTGTALIAARLATLEWAARRSGAPDLLLTAGFAFLAISEMELPRYLLGKSIKISRMTREVAAGFPRETIFVLVVAGLAVGLGVYAFRYRAHVIAWGWSALETTGASTRRSSATPSNRRLTSTSFRARPAASRRGSRCGPWVTCPGRPARWPRG